MTHQPAHSRHPSARPLRRARLACALATFGFALLAAAGVTAFTGWPDTAGPAQGAAPWAGEPNPAPVAVISGPDEQRPGPTPTALRLPALGVAAPVFPVAEQMDGSLAIPTDPRVLGWWYLSARPDSPRGTVVIVGHVDTARDGAGALFRLASARPNQRLTVDTDAGPREYVINAVHTYPKAQLPVADLFTDAGPPRLVLITCGGAFDRRTHQYADNVVVYAHPS